MHRVRTLTLVIVLLLGLSLPVYSAAPLPAPVAQQATAAPHPMRAARPVPPELLAELGQMTVDEFLAKNQGQVPKALERYVQAPSMVIVELEQPPLAQMVAGQLDQGRGMMSATAQRDYVRSLQQAQEPVVAGVQALGGQVISRYTKVYDGLLVKLPTDQLSAARDLSGVLAIHRAPSHHPTLAHSVPLIRAPQVWNNLGFSGTGVTIAVIDTGIDYYHADLGGSGNPADYANDNHAIIESGTFPTAKVIGGYDFAGADYDASDPAHDIPMPDPDPIDGSGHGTHVASIAAGVGVSSLLGPGVAPDALLYAVKVFGEPAGSTNLTMDGIEWAIDPDQDGDITDHADVINMSLGSDYGPASDLDPSVVASNNAALVGVIVVASSGNAGDVPYITGSPAAADRAISVASSTTGYITGPTISVTDVVTLTNIIYQTPEFDSDTGHFTETVTATLSYAGALTATDTLCSIAGLPSNAFAGNLALIQRGDCAFTMKVNNAGSLGAVGAIIFNNASGGNSRVTMSGDPVTIPAGFVTHDDGVGLADADGHETRVSADTDVLSVADLYTPADTISGFSSRGPRSFDSALKPEVTAPGTAIYAAAIGTGDLGTSLSGTSMAAPHVAGVAALLREAHPGWSQQQIKAAVMNTAVDLVDGSPIPRMGTGRVDAYAAASANAIAVGDDGLVSLSWGAPQIGTDVFADQKAIALHSTIAGTSTYTVSWTFQDGSLTAGFGLAVPSMVTVTAAPAFETFPVPLSIDATQVPVDYGTLEEYFGYVVLSNTQVTSDVLRVPFYTVPRPYSRVSIASSPLGISNTTGLAHSGPIASDLFAYPAYTNDPNDLLQRDEADLRLLGMDYGGASQTYGDIFVPAINTWGAWTTPQPDLAEFDLYLDVDQNGSPDLIDFNWNYGAVFGTGDDNTWVVIQVDLATSTLSLGSPFLIYTDYNNGYMEWYLPATWNGLDDIGGADTDFEWQLFGFDSEGNADASNMNYFDLSRPPFTWSLTGSPGPGDPTATLAFWISDESGYQDSNPLGLMLVDYNGQPGQGQAQLVAQPTRIYLPIVFKSF